MHNKEEVAENVQNLPGAGYSKNNNKLPITDYSL